MKVISCRQLDCSFNNCSDKCIEELEKKIIRNTGSWNLESAMGKDIKNEFNFPCISHSTSGQGCVIHGEEDHIDRILYYHKKRIKI